MESHGSKCAKTGMNKLIKVKHSFLDMLKMAASICRLYTVLCFLISLLQKCVTERKDIFSTKTPYAWVYDLNTPISENEYAITEIENRRCFAVNLQAVVRHGARYPGYKDIRKMTEFHRNLKLAVKSQEFAFLYSWENDFPESHEKQLVDEGEEEQFGLGQRFGKRFKSLFRDSIDNVHFYSSSKERSLDSAFAFYEGFTEELLHEAYNNLTYETKDDLMRFHTTCQKFLLAVENNKTHFQFQKLFKKGPEIRAVAENVKNRLGLKQIDIEAGDLKLIYFWCTFEMFILGKDDWCHMLTDEEKEVLEYQNDLKQYWKKGYGHPVNGGMACPLVKTLFQHLSSAADLNLRSQFPVGETAAFYFGHAETVGPLYTALGLFNDSKPLKHDNFKEMKNRLFKSSRILPFSANFAIVLYKCDHPEVAASSMDDYVVRFYVNEQPLKIPVCDDYVCKFNQVKEAYKHHIDCDFNEVCRVHAHDEL